MDGLHPSSPKYCMQCSCWSVFVMARSQHGASFLKRTIRTLSFGSCPHGPRNLHGLASPADASSGGDATRRSGSASMDNKGSRESPEGSDTWDGTGPGGGGVTFDSAPKPSKSNLNSFHRLL